MSGTWFHGLRRPAACRPLAAVACAAAAAVTLSGCGSGSGVATVKLPPKPSASSPSSVATTRSRPAALTPRRQVIAAYTGFLRAGTAALDSRSAARARALLAPYVPASAIPGYIRAYQSSWSRHEIAYGSVIPHILGVTVTGSTAAVHDCQDSSHAGLQNLSTGQVVPGTLGTADFNLIARLARKDGHWLFSLQTAVIAPCKARL